MSQVEEFLRTAKELLEQAERAAGDQRLIMKVGVELGASLDYETTIQNVARLRSLDGIGDGVGCGDDFATGRKA